MNTEKKKHINEAILWVCDRCGGAWPNPHFDSQDIQAEFDAITTCSTCLSLEMAKKRIAELEQTNESRVKKNINCLFQDPLEFAIENGRLKKRIAELEAAQAWRPASEPPECADAHDSEIVYGEYKYGRRIVAERVYYNSEYNEWYNVDDDCVCEMIRWHELPPRPESSWDESKEEPTGKCMNCGDYVFNGDNFCCCLCELDYMEMFVRKTK